MSYDYSYAHDDDNYTNFDALEDEGYHQRKAAQTEVEMGRDAQTIKDFIARARYWRRQGDTEIASSLEKQAASIAADLWHDAIAYRRLNPLGGCPRCSGCGKVVLQVRNPLYKCGFSQVAETCPVCLGTGHEMPVPEDFKAKAANNHA